MSNRRMLTLFFATAVLLTAESYAAGAPALTVSDGSRVIVIDGVGAVTYGGSCVVPTTCSTTFSMAAPGQVVWGGTIGTFTIPALVGLTKPIEPAPATMDLNIQGATTSAPGTLTVEWSDTGFTATGPTTVKMFAGGLIGGSGSLVISAYGDNANTLFGKGVTIGTLGPFSGPTVEGSLPGAGPTTSPFSLTEKVVVTLGAGANIGLDFEIDMSFTPETAIACRMTGGGVDTNFNWDHTLVDGQMITNGAGKLPAGVDRYQYGGQAGAPTASQPQPWGEWQHHQQTGPSGSFSFHAGTASAPAGTRIVEIRCSDPVNCNPARPAPAKQLDFDAIGTFSNVGKGVKAPHFQIANANVIPEPNGANKVFTYHWVQVNVDDLGEPGNTGSSADPTVCPGRGFGEKSAGPFVPAPVTAPSQVTSLPKTDLGRCGCPDFYRITIYNGVLSTNVTYLPDGKIDPASLDRTNVIYEVFGYVDGGNIQIHPPTSANK